MAKEADGRITMPKRTPIDARKRRVGPAATGDNMANETKYSLPRVMTVKELSEYLRVHPSTIYKLLRRGELPGFRIGTDWRFNAEVIDRWCLERNMKAEAGPSNRN
ncbi:MAG TPA: helix-turn-helix domain-containing protein [Candidatus Binataceae bacterium]